MSEGNFTYAVERSDGRDVLRFKGPIDEVAAVRLIKAFELTGTRYVFDLAGVTSVNSMGVRGWITFMRSFQESREIVFEGCSVPVVAQIAMIGSFRGKAKVRSAYAAMNCEDCQVEDRVLVERPQTASGLRLPEARCPRCRGELIWDNEDELRMALAE